MRHWRAGSEPGLHTMVVGRVFRPAVDGWQGGSSDPPYASLDDQLPLHVLAAVVLGQIAVVREGAGLIGAEFERDGLAGAGALRNAVAIDSEAVGDVFRGEIDLHQVVTMHFDRGRPERVVRARDR